MNRRRTNYCISAWLWSIDASKATVQQRCGLRLNDTLTTRIWQESVCHLLTQTCRQRPSAENKLLSSHRSKCLFKDGTLTVGLLGRVVRRLRMSLFVRPAVPALVTKTVDRWHRNCHESVPSVGVSWLLTCYITQYVVFLRWFQFRQGHSPKLITL